MAPVAVHLQDTIPISSPYPNVEPLRHTPDAVDLSSPPRRAPKERTPPMRIAFAFDTMESAIAAVARGEFVVVMDDEGRENEGDLIIPAAGCSTEQMAWMIKHTRYGLTPPPYTPHSPDFCSLPFPTTHPPINSGYICISLPGDHLEALSIPMMVPQNEERHRTAYTITVDYKHGTHSAPSSSSRFLNIRVTLTTQHRHVHGYLSARSCTHGPRARSASWRARAGLYASGTHGAPARTTGRRAHAPRAHRVGGRPVRARGTATRGPALRARQRRRARQHDAPRRLSCVRGQVWAAHD